MKAVAGHWIQFAYEERKTTANPTPYSIAGYMGYDGSKKQFVQTTVDNYGSYGPSFSDGWKSDTMTFEGSSTDADGKSMAVRDHFVRKSSTPSCISAKARARREMVQAGRGDLPRSGRS